MPSMSNRRRLQQHHQHHQQHHQQNALRSTSRSSASSSKRRPRKAKLPPPSSAFATMAALAAATLLCGSALLLWTTYSYRVLVVGGNRNGNNNNNNSGGGRRGDARASNSRNQKMPYLPNSLRQQEQIARGRRGFGGDEATRARNRERFLQRKLDRAAARRAQENNEGTGGGGGWLGYALRRWTDETGLGAADGGADAVRGRGGHLRELGDRFHDTHDALGGGGHRTMMMGRMGRGDGDAGADVDDRFYVPRGSAGLHLPTPVVVVGMPKSGTTSIFSYFKCGGQLASHFACNNHYTVNETAPESMQKELMRDMVQPESWRNCRLPAQTTVQNAQSNADIDTADDEHAMEREKRHAARSIDSGRFPLCSVCIERNILRGKPPLEGCGAYDIWAEIDSAEHPLPSLLAREQEIAREEREADEEGDESTVTGEDGDGQDEAADVEVEENAGGADVRPLCSYPQITRLEEIHEAYPNATFILNLRPVDNWIKSISKWSGDKRRTKGGYLRQVLTQCDLPGFPSGMGETDEEMEDFYNGHSRRIRDFVKDYPSHALVEVDIEAEDAGQILQESFGVSHHCWKVRNASPEKRGAFAGGQRLRDVFLDLRGKEVLGKRKRSNKSHRRKRAKVRNMHTVSEPSETVPIHAERNAQGTSHTKRQRQLSDENKSREGNGDIIDTNGEDEGDREAVQMRHLTREERQRIMRERVKKRMGALDQFRDRRNYPICEDLEDIFPVQ